MTICATTLTLDQDETGYRYSPDSFILADFFHGEGVKSVVDLCAGVGVVSILIGLTHPKIKLTAVEIRHKQALYAQRNGKKSGLNNFSAVTADIMSAGKLFKKEMLFDSVVSNPPFRKRGSGRISPDGDKAMATYELKMTLSGLVKVSSNILRENGSLNIIMTFDRLSEYRSILEEYGYSESRFREIRTEACASPKLFLSEARLKSQVKLSVETPFVLRAPEGGDSDQLKSVMARYGL
jgi:tRNA1Val (adenine37-N6)-methyltransferase